MKKLSGRADWERSGERRLAAHPTLLLRAVVVGRRSGTSRSDHSVIVASLLRTKKRTNMAKAKMAAGRVSELQHELAYLH